MTDEHRADALTIWDYHQMHHPIRPVSAGIGLGSHDLGVAAFAAQLYHQVSFRPWCSPVPTARPPPPASPVVRPSISPNTPSNSVSPSPRSSWSPAPPTPARTSTTHAPRWPMSV